MRKDQHEKYQAKRSLTNVIEANNTSENTRPDQSDMETNHRWPSVTCVVVGYLIVSGIDERRLSKKN